MTTTSTSPRVLVEEAAQHVDHVAEQDRAELAERVAEVDVARRVRGRWAGLRTQPQRVLRRLVPHRLHQPGESPVAQLGVDDLLAAGSAYRSEEGVDQEATDARPELRLDAPLLTRVEEAVLGVVHRVVRRGQGDLVEGEVAERLGPVARARGGRSPGVAKDEVRRAGCDDEDEDADAHERPVP